MKKLDLGQIITIVANLGVIAGFLLLAYELRQNTSETRAANRQTSIDSVRELTLTRAESPSLAAAISAVQSGGQATETQRSQYTAYLVALFRSVEGAYMQAEEGRLDEELLQTRVSALMIYLRTEPGRNTYQGFKSAGILTAEFSHWLDEQVESEFSR